MYFKLTSFALFLIYLERMEEAITVIEITEGASSDSANIIFAYRRRNTEQKY